MSHASTVASSAPIKRLQQRVERWRRTRSRRGPMPEELWQDAARLAQEQGVHPIAKALRVEYYALKRQVARIEKGAVTTGASFVEVSVSPPAAVPACLVEMERPDGSRMRVQVASSDTLVALADAFWGGRK